GAGRLQGAAQRARRLRPPAHQRARLGPRPWGRQPPAAARRLRRRHGGIGQHRCRPHAARLCRHGGLGNRPDRRRRHCRHPRRGRHDPRGLPAGGAGPDRGTAAAPDGGPRNQATANRRRKALTERGVLAPDLEVLAPVRDWGWTREETAAYGEARGLPVRSGARPLYSIDENLWGRAIECGALEDPMAEAPEDVWERTVDPRKAPTDP